MNDDFVALLGTKGGPAIRPGSAMPTSNYVVLDNQPIIVDCGLGVTKGLVDQGFELKNLSLIFISHLHSDHYLELGPLIHTAWTAGLTTPVEVYGPPGLSDYWNAFLLSMQADIELRIEDEGRPVLAELVRIHAMDAGSVFERDGLCVSAIRTDHPPLIDCFALSFQTSRTHVVFSGDTAPLAALKDFARGADLLVHEAMLESALPGLVARVGNGGEALMQHLLRSHSFAHDAAQTATQAGVKALALSHLIPADDPAYGAEQWEAAVRPIWSGPIFIAHDGQKIPLPVE
ncbi:MAG: MBL fold metallo-hydrolase [Pseudomonadota bacterium]